MATLIQPATIIQLVNLLAKYSVDTSQWNKKVDNLLEEIKNGESFLEIDKNGNLVRVVKIANIVITRRDGLTLRESYQIKNGKRIDKKNCHLTEKIGITETAFNGISRGIIEELGDKKGRDVVNVRQIEPEILEIKPSDSFRGMKCVYKLNRFAGDWIGTTEDFSTFDGHDGKQIFWIWLM